MKQKVGRLVEELKRRKVLQTAAWYLGVSFVIMQVVEVVFPYARMPDAAGTAVLVVLAVGFPVALVVSWTLRVTPPRFRREASAEGSGPGVEGPALRELRTDSVAVLPFRNLSDRTDDAYFSEGITEDIIASVAHIRGLRVLSRTSVMGYEGVQRRLGRIAGELGVATVVTGSVRRAGTRVRVTAEVVDARTEDHLWSDAWDRELEDIFQVQSDIASRIAEAVHRELSAADRARIEARGTENPEAYDLYLRARNLWNQRSEAAVSESIRFFERALEEDDRFALARSGLADAYAVLGIYGSRAPRDVFEAAAAEADAALVLDPGLGEAVATRACVRSVYDWEWEQAEEGFLRALELAPSYATAHQWYAMNLLVPLRRFDEARSQLSRAIELDPGSSAIAVSRVIVTCYEGDAEAAAGEFEKLVERHPRFSLAHFFLGQCRELTGDPEGALDALRRAASASDDSSETLAALGHAMGRSGRTAEAEAVLERLERRAAVRWVSPVLPAQVLLGLGREDQALGRLEEAVGVRATDLIWLAVRPLYDPVRERPRFQAVLREVGLR